MLKSWKVLSSSQSHTSEKKNKPQTREGDLEDYLKFLAKVQKATKENPVDVEFDFQ